MKPIKEQLIELIDEISNFEDIKLSDIPCVDLYMDQVTTFFDDKLSPLKRDADEKILTKTMINNYAKAKLLLPIKGKKYSKDQVVLLSLIYSLKQILSLNDLNLILSPIIKNLSLDKENVSLDEIYNVFLHINKLQREEFNSWFKNKLQLVSEEAANIESENGETIEVILTILMLISSANAQKKMAEKIIDKFLKPEK
ncbi:DUF1836 domain-containing protein [Candidatus Clostridium radicumherbarum]|uniref:DUF1836 domain-containing protein n=1 Tax=Candidatus Clostridium radicumherbarum TaxID=3381662 RepID=A0ABW8TXG3_9CLOT